MRYRVLLAAGGTGGHLLPASRLALRLKGEADVIFVGSGLSENPFFQKEDFSFHDIKAAPLWPPWRFLQKSGAGFFQSLRLLKKLKPDIVVGFGSHHTFPVLAAASCLNKKIVLYEANCVLGKVNRFIAPFADVIALQFPLQKKIKIKSEYVSFFPSALETFSRKEALSFYGFDASLPVCLVFGGSQGALFLNEKAPQILSGCQVIHCTGKKERVESVQAAYKSRGILAFVQDFEANMARAYAAASFALCRSGAGATAELIRFQLPAVMVPFPYATEKHQMFNARFFSEEARGGFWLDQREEKHLRSAIEKCISQEATLRESLQLFYQKTDKRVELADLVKKIGTCGRIT